jgi:hypothetical protein
LAPDVDRDKNAHNRKNDTSLWDRLARRQDNKQEDWNHEKEAQQFPSKNNFKHLMMSISVGKCSAM